MYILGYRNINTKYNDNMVLKELLS